MTAHHSLDGSTDHLPNYMRRSQGVKRVWTGEARCKQHTDDGLPAFAWTVEATDRGSKLLGRPAKEWIEMAVIMCGACPDQYNCARFGVVAMEQYNTWAMPIDDLRALQLRNDWRAIIDVAEDFQEPVAQAVRVALTRT